MRIWLASCLLLLGAPALRAATVISTQPAPESFAARDVAIDLHFDEAMDPASLDAHGVRVFGRWSGPAVLTLSWLDDNQTLRVTANEPFFAGELVTLRLARTLRSALGVAVPNGYALQFWTRSLPADLEFRLVGTVPIRDDPRQGVRAYGANAADLDDDGDSDLAVPCEDTSELRVFLNDGFGGYGDFTILPLLPGGGPSANDAADFDRDGQIDLILGNAFSDQAMILRGLGDGSFDTREDLAASNYVRGVAVVDLDGDACEDIVAANSQANHVAILRGDGLGGFAAAEFLNSSSSDPYGIAVGETNGDGLLDVFVGCNLGNRILLLQNDGEGGLVETASIEAGGRAWSLASGDLDGDGNCDVVSANSYTHNCAIALSDGAGGLVRTQLLPTGEFPLSIDLGDLDGDGDLDLITSNLFGQNWTLYENDGTGTFAERLDLPSELAGSCAIFHDRDGDGVLDFTGIDEVADLIVLFEHTASPPPLLPAGVRIWAATANPFADTIRLGFELTRDARTRMSVYDLRGQLVRHVDLQRMDLGEHDWSWDGRDAQGESVASGSYRVRIEAAGKSASLPVTKLR